MFRVCHALLSVHCSLVVTYWERANLLALVYVMFTCVLSFSPHGVLDRVWYLIVSIPDICLLTTVVEVTNIRTYSHKTIKPRILYTLKMG